LKNGTTYTVTPGRTDLGNWPLWGAFGELTWKPRPKWAFTGGLRYDDFGEQADPRLTPRLAAVYRPADYWSLKAIYGQSYLSPQWEHTNINSHNFSFASNPDLGPEQMQATDFIVQYQNPTKKVTGWMDVFVNKIDDIITSNHTGSGQQTYINFGSSEYWGFETGLQQDVLPSVRLFGSYSFVEDTGESDPQFINDGQILNVPRHIFRYGVRWQPLDKLVLNLWARTATGSRVTDSITGDNTRGDWTDVDFAAIYSFKRFEIRAKILNVFNEYYEIGGTVVRPLPRYERGFELSVGYYF
jgi:outer membrane receptor protein involved in Fe transport